VDADGDGFGVAGGATCLCAPAPPHSASLPGDCDDESASVHPSASEACNGVDDDCDGATDEADPVTGEPCKGLVLAPPVAGLSAVAGPAGIATLSWDAIPDPDSAGYSILRDGAVVATVVGETHVDVPDEGSHTYSVVWIDAWGNHSALAPSVGVTTDATPPALWVTAVPGPTVGEGLVLIEATASEPLAEPPTLTWAPGGGAAIPVPLVSVDGQGGVFTGQFEVLEMTPPGAAPLAWMGQDLVGNAAGPLSGLTQLVVDNVGPVGTVALPVPALKAGTHIITLTVNEALSATPSLSFQLPGAQPEPVPLAASGESWSGAVDVPDGANGVASFTFNGVDLLGNPGGTLDGAAVVEIDTMPPGAPVDVAATPGVLGSIHVSWSAPPGELVSEYALYRAAAPFSDVAGLEPLTTGVSGTFSQDTPPESGTYWYAVTAFDAAGNEGPPSATAASSSDQTGPLAPQGLTATVSSGPSVSLSWSAPAGEASAAYRVYRGGAGSIDPAAPPVQVVLGATAAVDLPQEDGTFAYAVAGVDSLLNEGPLSEPALVDFDAFPPQISVGGSLPDQLHATDVSLVVTIADPFLATQEVTLDGQPYVSGTPVGTPGPHTLSALATDAAGHVASLALSFAIDKSPPDLLVSGVVQGAAYFSPPAATFSATDAHLASVSATLNGVPYASGTPITGDGEYLLVVTAQDLAGNTAVESHAFAVNLPPPAVPSLTANVLAEAGIIELTWEPASDDTLLYLVTRDGQLLEETGGTNAIGGPAPDGHFRAVFTVQAIDSTGSPGPPRAVTVYPVAIALLGFGTASAAGDSELTRGYYDAAKFLLVSDDLDDVAVLGAYASVRTLGEGELWSGAAAGGPDIIPALGQAPLDAVVFTDGALADDAELGLAVQVDGGEGTTVTYHAEGQVAVRNPPGATVEPLFGPLVKGTIGTVQLVMANHGSAPLALVTAVPGGPTPDIAAHLETLDGGGVASTNLLDPSPPGLAGTHVAVIGPGQAWTSAPVELAVPGDAPDMLSVRVSVNSAYWSYGAPWQIGLASYTGSGLASLVAPAYTATATTDKPIYLPGEGVTISGVVTSTADGEPVPGALVRLRVSKGGFDATLYAEADTSGAYTASYVPLSGQPGQYAVSATHPDVATKELSATFSVLGLALSPKTLAAEVLEGKSTTVTFTLHNTGGLPVEGLASTLVSAVAAEGLTAEIVGVSPPTLAAGAKATLEVAIAAGVGAAGTGTWSLSTTGSGFALEATLSVSAVSLGPSVSVDPLSIEASLAAGQSTTRKIILTNKGYGPWEGVALQAPEAPGWILVTSPTDLGTILPGQSRSVDVLILPPADSPTGVHAAAISVTSANFQAFSVPVVAHVTAGDVGTVVAHVSNEVYKVTFPGYPVPGATVTITSQDDYTLAFQAVTDGTGTAAIPEIPVGSYFWQVSAPGFQTKTALEGSESGYLEVAAGQTTVLEAMLVESFVEVEWTVAPTTITDEYVVELHTTYDSSVPVPILVVTPGSLSVAMQPGATIATQLEIANVGLASAFNVTLGKTSGGFVEIQLGVEALPEIPAQTSIVVPLLITLDAAAAATGRAAPKSAPNQSGLVTPLCIDLEAEWIGITYQWYCEDGVYYQGMPTLAVQVGVQVTAPHITLSQYSISKATYYGCPGFADGQKAGPDKLTLTNKDAQTVEICDCGLLKTTKFTLGFLPSLDCVLGMLGEIACKTEALDEEGLCGIDVLLGLIFDFTELVVDEDGEPACPSESGVIADIIADIIEWFSEKLVEDTLEKYTACFAGLDTSGSSFDKTCLAPGGSATAELDVAGDDLVAVGFICATVSHGCEDGGPCCPVCATVTEATITCAGGEEGSETVVVVKAPTPKQDCLGCPPSVFEDGLMPTYSSQQGPCP
jgi:uncharacterized membrane protein